MTVSATATRTARYEARMRAAGFVTKHAWVPEEQAGRLEEIAAEIREQYRPDRVPVERCPPIIGEAVRKLGKRREVRSPEIPWHRVRNLGNWLRHDYDRTDYRAIWDTITEDLAVLHRACQRQLKS